MRQVSYRAFIFRACFLPCESLAIFSAGAEKPPLPGCVCGNCKLLFNQQELEQQPDRAWQLKCCRQTPEHCVSNLRSFTTIIHNVENMVNEYDLAPEQARHEVYSTACRIGLSLSPIRCLVNFCIHYSSDQLVCSSTDSRRPLYCCCYSKSYAKFSGGVITGFKLKPLPRRGKK